jgi:hypothetical protein
MPDSLTIELRRIAEAAIERSDRLPAAAALVTGGESVLVEPPTVSFVAQSSASGGIQVRGELDAHVRLTCRRCLAEYEDRFVVPLEFRLEPGLEPGAGALARHARVSGVPGGVSGPLPQLRRQPQRGDLRVRVIGTGSQMGNAPKVARLSRRLSIQAG